MMKEIAKDMALELTDAFCDAFKMGLSLFGLLLGMATPVLILWWIFS